MTLQPVTITSPPAGRPRSGTVLTVAGVEVTSAMSAHVTVRAGQFPTVDLELVAGYVGVELGAAAVRVDDATRDVLVAIGWTPPGDDPAPAGSSPAPRA